MALNIMICCLEVELNKSRLTPKGRPATPMQINYRPELNVTLLLKLDQANNGCKSYWSSAMGCIIGVNKYFHSCFIDIKLLSST